MQAIESNRIGKFEVSILFMNVEPKSVQVVMAECIVIGIDLQFYNGKAVYTAISDRFDEVPRGEMIPMYLWELEYIDEKKNVKVKSCKRV